MLDFKIRISYQIKWHRKQIGIPNSYIQLSNIFRVDYLNRYGKEFRDNTINSLLNDED